MPTFGYVDPEYWKDDEFKQFVRSECVRGDESLRTEGLALWGVYRQWASERDENEGYHEGLNQKQFLKMLETNCGKRIFIGNKIYYPCISYKNSTEVIEWRREQEQKQLAQGEKVRRLAVEIPPELRKAHKPADISRRERRVAALLEYQRVVAIRALRRGEEPPEFPEYVTEKQESDIDRLLRKNNMTREDMAQMEDFARTYPDMKFSHWSLALEDFVSERCEEDKRGFLQVERLRTEFILWVGDRIPAERLPSEITFMRILQAKEWWDFKKVIKSVRRGKSSHNLTGFDGVCLKSTKEYNGTRYSITCSEEEAYQLFSLQRSRKLTEIVTEQKAHIVEAEIDAESEAKSDDIFRDMFKDKFEDD